MKVTKCDICKQEITRNYQFDQKTISTTVINVEVEIQSTQGCHYQQWCIPCLVKESFKRKFVHQEIIEGDGGKDENNN